MALQDNVIVAYAEAKNEHRSGRDVWDIQGELLDKLLERSGLEKDEIDGAFIGPSLTGAGTPFWAQSTVDFLGLECDFLDLTNLGGCACAGAVARASAALDAGLCETIVLLNADTPSTEDRFRQRSYNDEWTEPFGVFGPPGAFGLLSQRYDHQFGLDPDALAKLAITQRDHAILNPNAVEKLRRPITADDYAQSRMIARPLRLLDCVMPCDGGNALLMMSRARAKEKGFDRFVVPRGYGERTNFAASNNCADVTQSGHQVAGARAFAQAGMKLKDIGSFHPYDDFLIAIMLNLEMFGFCKPGQGSAFINETDFGILGDIPLNTGGGQISAGQPGLAGGGLNLIEAVRQLFEEAGDRQVRNAASALVAGIGWIPYGRNWGSSVALVLEADG